MEFLPPARRSGTARVIATAAVGVPLCGGLLGYALTRETESFRQAAAVYPEWIRAAIALSFYVFAALCAALLASLSYALFRSWPGGPRLWRVVAVLLAVSWGLFTAAVLLVLLGDVSTALSRVSFPEQSAVESAARLVPTSEQGLAEDER